MHHISRHSSHKSGVSGWSTVLRPTAAGVGPHFTELWSAQRSTADAGHGTTTEAKLGHFHPRSVRACRAVPCRAAQCRAVPCRDEAIPCRAVPCRAVPCRAGPGAARCVLLGGLRA